MKKALLHATLKLSMEEYTETISSLVFEHYQRAMSEDELFRALDITGEAQTHFSMEYSTILLVIAALAFKRKPKMVSEKYQEQIRKEAALQVYRKIMPDGDEETIRGCVEFFEGKRTVFEQICTNIYQKETSARQKDIIGFARYLAAQVSTRDEKSNTKALECLGILLSTATDTFVALIENSIQDTVGWNRKPSFTVQK